MRRSDRAGSPPAATGDAGRQLRVLLSAYACEPEEGSEPGIGWQWALALARAGHEVWVLTRAANRPAIEGALDARPPRNLHFAYYDLPAWASWWQRGGRGARLYYLLWQLGAWRVARGLCRDVRFDVAHHLAFGEFRHPTFLAFLDLPFVFGPVGGSHTAPRPLRATFPLRGYLADLAHEGTSWAARVDPLTSIVYRRAAALLCRTRETLMRIPARYREKCVVQLEVGTDGQLPPAARRWQPARAEFRVLYVGQLVYSKGLHLGLMAFARFRRAHPDAHLTVIGSGPDEAWFRALARELDLDGAVTWTRRVERAAVMRAYPRHDVLLFPGLHDSRGNAVLEALSCAVPVVCLDVGGPAELVDASCGLKVRPGTPEDVVAALAGALSLLAADHALARTMGEAAVRRARERFSWSHQAARMSSLYRKLSAGWRLRHTH